MKHTNWYTRLLSLFLVVAMLTSNLPMAFAAGMEEDEPEVTEEVAVEEVSEEEAPEEETAAAPEAALPGFTLTIKAPVCACGSSTCLNKVIVEFNNTTTELVAGSPDKTITVNASRPATITAVSDPECGYGFTQWTRTSTLDGSDPRTLNTNVLNVVFGDDGFTNTIVRGDKFTYVAAFSTPATVEMFTVTYTDGVGGKAFADQTYEVKGGSATPAFDGEPKLTGMRFTGWDPAVAKTVSTDATYTAQWEDASNVTLTLSSGYLSGTSPYKERMPKTPIVIDCKVGDEIDLGSDAMKAYIDQIYSTYSKDGKEQVVSGFSSKQVGTQKLDGVFTIEENTTLTAAWTNAQLPAFIFQTNTDDACILAVYKLSDPDVYTNDAPLTVYAAAHTHKFGTIGLKYQAYTEDEGLIFQGWFDPDGNCLTTAALVDARDMGSLLPAIDEDYYIEARFETAVTVTVDTDGGTPVDPMTVAAGSEIKAPKTEKTGYNLVGWMNEEGEMVEFPLVVDGDMTLTAVWEAATVDIKYELNGGVNNEANPASYKYDEVVTLADPCKEGYVFAGWYDNAAFEGEPVTELTAGACVVYAKWDSISYTIAFSANGGNGSMESITAVSDEVVTLPENTFTMDKCKFVGWNTAADGSGTAYADGAEVVNLASAADEVITLYAQWEGANYKILFDGNGAESGEMEPLNMNFGMTAELPEVAFVRTGYVFDSWNTKKDGKGVSFADKAAVRNLTYVDGATITLYAQWAKQPDKYSIVFNGNGDDASATKTMANLVFGKTYTLTANTFKKAGYHFVGWAETADGEVVYANKEKVTDIVAKGEMSITLYAVWAKNEYTVTFNGNGGKAGTAASYTGKMVYDTESTLDANRFVKPGYTFTGWNTKKNGSGTAYTDAQIAVFNLTNKENGKVTLYAQWKANGYKIVFNINGGEGSIDDMDVEFNKSVKLPKAAAAGIKFDGRRFVGWEQKSIRKVYKDGASIKNLTATEGTIVVLTAQWDVNLYNVAFNLNGGKASDKTTFAKQTKLSVIGPDVAIPDAEPTLANYVFAGWNTKKDGTGDHFDKGTSVALNATKNNQTITLYAEWAYELTFNSNEEEAKVATQTAYKNQAVKLTDAGMTREGYTLVGWNTNQAKAAKGTVQYKIGASVKNLAGKPLYAVWKAN